MLLNTSLIVVPSTCSATKQMMAIKTRIQRVLGEALTFFSLRQFREQVHQANVQ